MLTMKQLRRHVVPHIAAEWEALADILLDSASAVAQLRANHPTVAERCAETFRLWLKRANPEWKDMLRILNDLGHKTLSVHLRNMIGRGELE